MAVKKAVQEMVVSVARRAVSVGGMSDPVTGTAWSGEGLAITVQCTDVTDEKKPEALEQGVLYVSPEGKVFMDSKQLDDDAPASLLKARDSFLAEVDSYIASKEESLA